MIMTGIAQVGSAGGGVGGGPGGADDGAGGADDGGSIHTLACNFTD